MNPRFEILKVELELLEHHELPSVFFRFPGLISNSDWIHRLKQYSLIPIGSDAWLAKGEYPTPGSVILVHANGNEPEGIHRFLNWLTRNPADANHFLSLDRLF